jgi:hypothetical protein
MKERRKTGGEGVARDTLRRAGLDNHVRAKGGMKKGRTPVRVPEHQT